MAAPWPRRDVRDDAAPPRGGADTMHRDELGHVAARAALRNACTSPSTSSALTSCRVDRSTPSRSAPKTPRPSAADRHVGDVGGDSRRRRRRRRRAAVVDEGDRGTRAAAIDFCRTNAGRGERTSSSSTRTILARRDLGRPDGGKSRARRSWIVTYSHVRCTWRGSVHRIDAAAEVAERSFHIAALWLAWGVDNMGCPLSLPTCDGRAVR